MIGIHVWRKGTGTLFPDRSRHPRWLPPITGRSNPNQATAAGSSPRKSFLFCLTHEYIPGSSSAGDRVSRCGRAPRLSCASWCFCWSVKTWSRGSSNGLVVNNADSHTTCVCELLLKRPTSSGLTVPYIRIRYPRFVASAVPDTCR